MHSQVFTNQLVIGLMFDKHLRNNISKIHVIAISQTCYFIRANPIKDGCDRFKEEIARIVFDS